MQSFGKCGRWRTLSCQSWGFESQEIFFISRSLGGHKKMDYFNDKKLSFYLNNEAAYSENKVLIVSHRTIEVRKTLHHHIRNIEFQHFLWKTTHSRPLFCFAFGLFKHQNITTIKCGQIVHLVSGFELTTSSSHDHKSPPLQATRPKPESRNKF